jgi:glycosyltransferase involved in cell wall biosynthesis
VRILIVTDTPRQWESGGSGVLLNHARELEKLGHSVECWFDDDILTKPVRPQRFKTLIVALRVARRILRARDKYDVVDIQTPVGCLYGAWRRFFGKRGTPPYVFTMQGIVERHAHVMRRENSKGRAWNFSWKNRLWFRLYHQTMYDWSIKLADFGVASNREAWTYPELKHDCEPSRLWYLPNGVEERFFIPHDYRNNGTIRLLFVGTWLDRKGIYYLCEAFQRLAQLRPDVELTVAGCSSREEEVIRFFAPEIRGKVRVIPFVKRDDILAIYADHDIFVFPSLMEGMPLSLLEAMATAMPVVTTETCGMADVVEDGFNGLLVPPANTEKLVAAVERLCRSLELRERLGREAQQTMRRYTWARVTQKLEMVLALATQQSELSVKGKKPE